MKTRRKSSGGLVSLLMLCLVLAATVTAETRYPNALVLRIGMPGSGTPEDPGPDADGAVEDGVYRPPAEAVFEIIEERPLFAPDRRPPEEEVEPIDEGPPPPTGLDGLVLTGIIGAGPERVAIIEPTGPPRPDSEALSLHVGDKLRGWSVAEIATDRIVLQHGDRRFEMELTEDPRRRQTVPRRPQPGGLRTPGIFTQQPQQAPQQRIVPQPAPQSQNAPQPQSTR